MAELGDLSTSSPKPTRGLGISRDARLQARMRYCRCLRRCEAVGAVAILLGGWKGETGKEAGVAVGSTFSAIERVSERRQIF